MGPPADSPFVTAVKRAFADALLAEIRYTRLGREATATAGRLSRGFLQRIIRAEQQPSLSTFISLAEGLGVRPDDLMKRTMEHLSRLRADVDAPAERSWAPDLTTLEPPDE
jgi:transcriptional regulator with XRE-family HTH domain